MMPSTVMTAILLRASLSSSMTSSRRGPTWRAVPFLKVRSKALLKLNACETACVKFPNRLNASSTIKMIATTIQPRFLGGLDGGGGVMTGGGISGGGEEKDGFSITNRNYFNAREGARRIGEIMISILIRSPIIMHQRTDLLFVNRRNFFHRRLW